MASYFKREWRTLLAVTISGLIYNIGLLAGPWFEGRMAGELSDIIGGFGTFKNMLLLVILYVISIIIVQLARYIKRFYVRRFANNVSRHMKMTVYKSFVNKTHAELAGEDVGNIMTRAILDVDDCAEGMRKFVTELFDTGVALLAYAGMLLWYDYRLALICLIFPPVSYFIAEKMKGIVVKSGVIYKEQAAKLSRATLDRVTNGMTYRVYGCEKQRREDYENNLKSYEMAAVRTNIWATAMTPLYRIISMSGIVFILYFGAKNICGTGWRVWTVAEITTFISCFTKLSTKSSKAAKLFNSVHRAEVSWNRIKPFMGEIQKEEKNVECESGKLMVCGISFTYPDGRRIFENVSFNGKPGQVIGVTGPVACGKSTLGRAFLCEYPYGGSITYSGLEIKDMTKGMLNSVIGYMGHDTELFNDTIKNNILMGDEDDVNKYLKAVCFEDEIKTMDNGVDTIIGDGGVRLSGGQAQRIALARLLCHRKKVLILDDPFSALDRETESRIFENIRSMAKDSLIILISHRLYMFPYTDLVIWMDEGKVCCEKHEKLLCDNVIYKKLFDEQGALDNE